MAIRRRFVIAAATTMAIAAAASAGTGQAAPAGPPVPDFDPTWTIGGDVDDLPNPLADEMNDRRDQALTTRLAQKAAGKPVADGPVAQVAHGQFVEMAREDEDSIWTVLGEFGDLESPYGILQGGAPGPQHNQIPEPDRAVDNTTIWEPDFSEAYYEELLFSEAPGAVSMRNFYIAESSNRYTVDGDVTDWGQVPYRAAHYGRDWCGSITCGQTTWWFVRDSVDAWYANELAAGKSVAEIDDYLSQFDVWDRYDYDNDGNFDEPDGYIDHFQSVHAGEGQETGGGSYGSDAIWSHRWYVQLTPIGTGGPTLDDGTVVPNGGTRVGGSKYWIGDYTIEPENGGIGVFTHEYGHDLGLPDLYDTSGNTGGGENSTGFWTLYSSGSYGSTGIPEEGIGSKPIPMSSYEKISLGWSNYQVVNAGQKASVKLGPITANTKQAQTLVVPLPDKQVTFDVGDPYSGDYFYYSGQGNELFNTMTRDVSLPAGTPALSAKVSYDIELDWDYAYLTVNGAPVETDLSTNTNPNGNNLGQGITGTSGGWVDLTADLSAYAGQTVTIGFLYDTDEAVVGGGFFADDIAITGQALDDAETDPGWAYDGFIRTPSEVERSFFNAYFVEYRNYRGYDDGLRTGPYHFTGVQPNEVRHFPYQDGMLVWYYDTSFEDNNVGDHCANGRCGGEYLPVDAHPALLLQPNDGMVYRPRVQSYDSTFGLQPTDEVCLLNAGVEGCFGGLPANPVFDDTQSYWVPPDPAINHLGWASVQVPATGTTIRVVNTSAQGNFMQVQVAPKTAKGTK